MEFNLNLFKTETLKAYTDMAMELLMVKGLTENAIGRIAEVKSTLSTHTALLNNHTTLLNNHTTLLNEHTSRFDRLETMLSQILARLPEKP